MDDSIKFISNYVKISRKAQEKTSGTIWKDSSDYFIIEYIKLLLDKAIKNIENGNLKSDSDAHTFAEKNIAEAFVEIMTFSARHNLKIASAITAHLRGGKCTG
jgi:hypothetical protein